jgi:hypothetical protein
MLEMQKAQGLSADAQMRLLERVAGAFNRSRPTFPFEEVTGMVLGVARKVFVESPVPSGFYFSHERFFGAEDQAEEVSKGRRGRFVDQGWRYGVDAL